MQVVVRTVDKTNPDPERDKWNLKAEEIIDIVEQGHPWTSRELTNPIWRIISFPLLSMSDLQPFMEYKVDGQNKPLQRRRYKFDSSHPSLPQEFITFWNDNSRATPIYTSSITPELISSFRKEKV